MKIEVFASVDRHAGKPDVLNVDDNVDHLRVRLTLNGVMYDVAPRLGRLELRSVDGRQLSVRPVAANLVEVDADPWPTPEKKEKKRAKNPR